MLRYVLVSCLLSAVSCTCQSSESSAFKLKIVSRRNETGQWTAQVRFGHGGDEESLEGWEVDIQHAVTKCQDSEAVDIDVTITAPSDLYSPAPGYKVVPGIGYYRVYHEPLSWSSAVGLCQEDGSHLLILNSEKEAMATQHLVDNVADWYHIGLHDLYTEGEYVSIFNDTLQSLGYQRWAPGEPHNNDDENCICFSPREGMADSRCSTPRKFICERSL